MEFDAVLIEPRREAMRESGYWPDETLTQHLERCRTEFADKLAVVAHRVASGETTRLSYAELAGRVDAVAAGLHALGVGPRDVVSFQLPNSWEFIALVLATARLGAAANPLMSIFRERELRFMLAHAESSVFVCPREFRRFDHAALAASLRDELPDLQNVLLVDEGNGSFDELWRSHVGAPLPDVIDDADAVAELMYTSGTTGEPKGVMHTANTLFANLHTYAEAMRLSAEDVIFMGSPMAHQTGFLYGAMMPVMLGTTSVTQDVWQADVAVDLMSEYGATFTMGATPFLKDVTEDVASRGKSLSLKKFLCGGAAVPEAVAARGREILKCAVVAVWGMTEIGVVTATSPDPQSLQATWSDGAVFDGVELKIVDPAGNACGVGVEGSLLTRACSHCAGYLKRPELNGIDTQGWFDTGDLARWNDDGSIRITGRKKDLVIRGGENIPVVEIENLLYTHPDVIEAAVVGYPDPRLGERICAYLRCASGQEVALPALAAFLLDAGSSKSYLPERLVFLEEFPKTPSGKIQKFKLREMAREIGDEA